MGVLLVLVVVVAVLGVVVVFWLSRAAPAADLSAQEALPASMTLKYAIPEGQDPAALLAVLAGTTYEAALERDRGRRILVVTCPRGTDLDRPEVRALLAAAGTTIQDPARVSQVRFEDESHYRR